MATAELMVAFGAKLDGLEASLKRVNTKFGDLEAAAKKSSDSVSASMDKASKSVDGLGAMLVSAGRGLVAFYVALKGATAARDVALAIDDINASIRRMQVLTGGTLASARNNFEALRAIAASTGQPVKDMADNFTRFYVATQSIGASTEQVQQFVRVLAQFGQISGGGQQVTAAITQLGQGLASGKLQGDELKSILENMPPLAEALARSLNVSVGQLRQMGEEGKLTANVVFPAILRLAQGMQARLVGIPLSLRQGWQVLSDTALAAITELDRRIGASSWLSRLIVETANIINALNIRAVDTNDRAAPAETRLASLRRQGQEAIATIRQLETLISETERNRGRLDPSGNQANRESLLATRRRELEQARTGLANINGQIAIQQEEADTAAAIEARKRAREASEQQVRDDARRRRDILEGADGTLKAARERDERITALEASSRSRRAEAIRAGGDNINRVENEIRQERAAIQAQYEDDVRKATATDRAAASAREAEQKRQDRERRQRENEIQRNLNVIREAGDTGLAGFREVMRQWDEATGEDGRAGSAFSTFLDNIARSAAPLQEITILFRAITREGERAAQSMIQAGESPQPAIDAMTAKLRELMAILQGRGIDPAILQEAFDAAMGRAGASVQRMGDKATKTFNDIKVSAINTFSGDLAQTVVDFAATGEAKFSEFAASFGKMIAKMILELLIFKAIVESLQYFGFSVPGITRAPSTPPTTPGGVPRMAGGPVSAGGLYMVGENGRELFSPGESGYITPDVGAGGNVEVNIYNQSGAAVRTQESQDPFGNKQIAVFIEEAVKKGMAGGRFDQSMRQNYGLVRPGRV